MIQVYKRNFNENEKWSGDVKTKWHPGEGIFSKSGAEIAKEAKSGHNGDVGAAIKSLTFAKNRAGKNMSDTMKSNIDAAIHHLQSENKKEESIKVKEHFNEPDYLDYPEVPSDDYYGSLSDEEEERELARRHVMRHAGVPFEPEFAERYKSPYSKLKEDANSAFSRLCEDNSGYMEACIRNVHRVLDNLENEELEACYQEAKECVNNEELPGSEKWYTAIMITEFYGQQQGLPNTIHID